ncbi:30S ribosome-binding factor RbfA [Arhodomonas sp. SL1]|uniref:30S ribosome-binding factor RbfA n=1 Tax=Arhodomonas sp. SL1 TaxID=3425691 RepID=UPI003F881EDB
MAREFSRARRVGEQIQRELAELIRDEVRDPRVGSVTVSEVQVSRDFAHAKVMVTVLGAGAEDSADAVEALNHAAGFLRSQLARRVRLRQVPALEFRYDETFDRGARLSRLIDEVAPDDPDDDQDRRG